MSTSFDNLVARKGSPTQSLRSGSTNASASNSSETRDISRQSAQRARINHRRAIQARKVMFLVLILLLILGGLSYAIYRVVSNDSEENEPTKIKLEKDRETSTNRETSSVIIKGDKNSIAHETTKVPIFSKREERYSTDNLASTISKAKRILKPFTSPEEHRTSTILNTHETPSLQSIMEHTSTYLAVQNELSSSIVSTETEITKFIEDTIKKNTYTPAPTSNIKEQSSFEYINKHSSAMKLKITETSQYQSMEITVDNEKMTPSKSLGTPQSSSLGSKLDQLLQTPETETQQSSTVKVQQNIPLGTTIQFQSSLQQTPSSSPMLAKDKTVSNGMISTSIISSSVISQLPTNVYAVSESSASSTSKSSSQVSKPAENSFTTRSLRQIPSPTTVKNSMTNDFYPQTAIHFIASSESTKTFSSESTRVENYQIFSSSKIANSDESKVLSSSPTIFSEVGPMNSSVMIQMLSSKSEAQNAGKLINSTIVKMISTSSLSSISPTRNAVTAPNTSQNVAHTKYHDNINISTSTSVLIFSTILENGRNASVSLKVSETPTAIIQRTKTFATPVVSSSVWIAPYYYQWSNWSTCSLDCGGGYTYQTRNCSQHSQCGHLGPSINASICNFHKCNETTYEVSLNLTDYEWTDDFYNTTSKAYMDLIERLMDELRALYGPNVSVEINNISQGSVIVSFTIKFSSSNHINNLTSVIGEGKIGNLSVALVKMVNNNVPGKPDFILFQNITTNSTIIRWSPIQANETNGILLGYKVILTPGNANWTLDDHVTSVNVSNLIPDTSYTLRVHGFNINGNGERMSASFRTKELPPHFLPWSNWTECTRDCGGGVTSRNRSCSKEDKCSHLGEYEQKEYCNVEKCNETSYEVGLNVTNAEWTDDLYNTSSAAYQELLAKFIAELKKKYPNATIELGTITKGSVIFKFKITFPQESKTNAESLAEDLEETGLGNYTTEVKSIENTNLPRLPPGSINVTMVTHHSAVITWLPISEEDSNGAIIGYNIILEPGDNKTVELNVTAQASDTEFTYILEMLAPNSTYKFYIYGYNINGDGPQSELSNFTTKVQIPKIVSANITDITTSHALLSWQRINDNNHTYGVITGYKIFVTYNDQKHINLKVSSSKNDVHLNNLVPNTTYGVKVLGFNDYGDGVISDMFNFTTRIQIPEVPSGKVSHITRTSAVFSWNKIPDSEESYGTIAGYKIIIYGREEKLANITVSKNESWIELQDLVPGAVYNLTVIGFNSYGDGLIRDVFGFRTRLEEHVAELETSVHSAFSVLPSQSQSNTAAEMVLSTEILTRTVIVQASNTTMKEIQQRKSSSMISNSVHGMKKTSAKISSTTTVGDKATLTVMMKHHSVPSVTSSNTYQDPHDSSYTFSSQIGAIRPTNTKATTSVFKSSIFSSSAAFTQTSFLQTTNSLSESSSSAKTSITPTKPKTSEASELQYIIGKIRLTTKSFNSALSDHNSEEYTNLTRKVEKSLEKLFKEEGLQLESVKVLGFTKGSVIVDFYVVTAKEMQYQTGNFTVALQQAANDGGLDGQSFEFNVEDFSTAQNKPTTQPTLAFQGSQGLQKNEDEDDSALIVAVVICVLLVIGVSGILFYIAKKKNWFKRSKRKVVPEDDDDDNDDLYSSPAHDTVRLKTARGGRRSRGARINGGHSTTEC